MSGRFTPCRRLRAVGNYGSPMRRSQSFLLVGTFLLVSMFMPPAAAPQAAPAQAPNPPTPTAAPAATAPQAGQGRGRGGGAPAVVSPEVSADRRITFRIAAPQAQAVRVAAGDIPGLGQNGVMTKGENG